MDTAIACNTRASFHIVTEDYEGAFNLLRTSLLSLLTVTEKNLQIRGRGEKENEKPHLRFSSPGWQPGFHRFYSGSFVLSRDESSGRPEGEEWTKQHVDFCSAACLFNMALACHMEYEASSDCPRRTSLLSQAKMFYLTSYEVLQKYRIQPYDSVVLLLMALCANLVDIEIELGLLDEVRFWLRILEDASYAADPSCFRPTSVFQFFATVYVAPGKLIAAQAA